MRAVCATNDDKDDMFLLPKCFSVDLHTERAARRTVGAERHHIVGGEGKLSHDGGSCFFSQLAQVSTVATTAVELFTGSVTEKIGFLFQDVGLGICRQAVEVATRRIDEHHVGLDVMLFVTVVHGGVRLIDVASPVDACATASVDADSFGNSLGRSCGIGVKVLNGHDFPF